MFSTDFKAVDIDKEVFSIFSSSSSFLRFRRFAKSSNLGTTFLIDFNLTELS